MDLKKKYMINILQIFTWWNRQTIGTFLKTLIFGKFVGLDEYGNKFYQSKNNERWVIYGSNVEASRITSDWYLWMHHTVQEPPLKKSEKYLWQKEHSENLAGTEKQYRPSKIKKNLNNKKYETWNN